MISFDLLGDDDLKLGETSVMISNLGPGQTYRVPAFTMLRDFKAYQPRPLNCFFEQ